MVRKATICSKDEIVTKASDFVKCYKDVEKFAENYLVDTKILGEGKQSLNSA